MTIEEKDLIRIANLAIEYLKQGNQAFVHDLPVDKKWAIIGLTSLNLVVVKTKPLKLAVRSLLEEYGKEFYAKLLELKGNIPKFKVHFYNEFGEYEGEKVPDRPCIQIRERIYQAFPNFYDPKIDSL